MQMSPDILSLPSRCLSPRVPSERVLWSCRCTLGNVHPHQQRHALGCPYGHTNRNTNASVCLLFLHTLENTCSCRKQGEDSSLVSWCPIHVFYEFTCSQNHLVLVCWHTCSRQVSGCLFHGGLQPEIAHRPCSTLVYLSIFDWSMTWYSSCLDIHVIDVSIRTLQCAQLTRVDVCSPMFSSGCAMDPHS